MITSTYNDEIIRVAQFYGVGPIAKIETLEGGLINKTFYVENVYDDVFIIQVLHKMFKKDLMKDVYVVTQHLLQKGWNCPKLLPLNGKSLFYENNGHLWRVYEYVKGDNFSHEYFYKNLYKDVGLLLGSLHKDLDSLRYTPGHILKGFHDKDFYIQKALSISKKAYSHKLQNILDDAIIILENCTGFLHERRQIIHGDPRVENILFTKQHVPFVFIDYDTFMMGSVYIDIGDCLRSLLSLRDDIDFKNIVAEFLFGYNSSDAEKEEISYRQAVSAAKYVTLELYLRFAIDSVEKSYFSWDDKKYTTREEHNEARTLETRDFFNKLNQAL